MQWQDWVLSIGSFIFSVALLPSLLGKSKPAISSSMLTGSVLIVFAITYLSLQLWLSVFSTGLLAVLWFVLGLQKWLEIR